MRRRLPCRNCRGAGGGGERESFVSILAPVQCSIQFAEFSETQMYPIHLCSLLSSYKVDLPHVELPEEDEDDGEDEGGEHHPRTDKEYNNQDAQDIQRDLNIRPCLCLSICILSLHFLLLCNFK